MRRFTAVLAAASLLCLGVVGFSASAMAADCLICTSDSGGSCSGAQYCKAGSGGTDSDARKKCQAAGCKIGGTGSCPTAANVKVCVAQYMTPADQQRRQIAVVLPWGTYGSDYSG